MSKNKATASEILEILKQPWANRKDVARISGKCLDYAGKDMKIIATNLEKDGYKLPNYLVPMDKVVEYYNINISYLKKMCSMEKTKGE